MKIHKIESPLFAYEKIYIITKCKRITALKYLNKTYNGSNFEDVTDLVNGSSFFVENKKQGCIPFIWLDIKEDYIRIIWHEAFHVTCYFLREHDIELSTNTEEVYAYFLDNLVCKIIDILDMEGQC